MCAQINWFFSVCLDQGSTYSGDLESEARSTPFSWADPEDSSHNLKPPVPLTELEGPKEPPATITASNLLDLEKDIPRGGLQILIIHLILFVTVMGLYYWPDAWMLESFSKEFRSLCNFCVNLALTMKSKYQFQLVIMNFPPPQSYFDSIKRSWSNEGAEIGIKTTQERKEGTL